MLKNSSLAYVTTATELFLVAQNISSATTRPLELFVVASIWYLVMTTLWGFVQSYLERRFNPSRDTAQVSFLGRLLGRAPRNAGATLAGTINR